MPKCYSEFSHASEYKNFYLYTGKQSMGTINLLLSKQSVDMKKKIIYQRCLWQLLSVNKFELSDFEFNIVTMIPPKEFQN